MVKRVKRDADEVEHDAHIDFAIVHVYNHAHAHAHAHAHIVFDSDHT